MNDPFNIGRISESELIERAAAAIEGCFGPYYRDALTTTPKQARIEVNEWLAECDSSPIDEWEFDRAFESFRKTVEAWVAEDDAE